jgi:hypothetical protein
MSALSEAQTGVPFSLTSLGCHYKFFCILSLELVSLLYVYASVLTESSLPERPSWSRGTRFETVIVRCWWLDTVPLEGYFLQTQSHTPLSYLHFLHRLSHSLSTSYCSGVHGTPKKVILPLCLPMHHDDDVLVNGGIAPRTLNLDSRCKWVVSSSPYTHCSRRTVSVTPSCHSSGG